MKTQLVDVSLAACFALVMLVTGSNARAQEVTNLPEGTQHALGMDLGLDSALVSRFAYGYRLRPSFWDHDVVLQAALSIPLAETDLADSRVDIGFRTTVVAYENLRLQAGLGGMLVNSDNEAFAGNALGVGIVLLPGYQSESWGLMAELGYEKMLAAHLRPSDLYREKGYAEAKSGFYADTAGNFRVGLRGGARIGSVELNARLGVTASEGGNPRFPPFYGMLGFAYAL